MDNKEIVNILAVDDRPENLLVLEQYLSSDKVNIIKAVSGNQALGLILEHPFALILMDVQMPDMNGFETADLIRQSKKTREIPIIFVTAISKEDKFVYKGYQSGAIDYLTKPFDPDILQSKVKVFIELFEQRQHLIKLNVKLEKRVESRTHELRIAKEKAEEANIAKSRFLSNMSHELMTPLHCVLSYANIGLKSAQKTEHSKHEKYFDKTVKCGNRLQILLDDLLDLSRLQAGEADYTFTKNNIRHLILTVCNNLKNSFEEKSTIINVEASTLDMGILCDTEHMTQVFHHLIFNAIQYSEIGETIEITFCSGDIKKNGTTTDALEILVADNGIGIPEAELEEIFDFFKESSITESTAGGKGIGLPIAREIVQAHHGKIWAKSNQPGSVFHILLPYVSS